MMGFKRLDEAAECFAAPVVKRGVYHEVFDWFAGDCSDELIAERF